MKARFLFGLFVALIWTAACGSGGRGTLSGISDTKETDAPDGGRNIASVSDENKEPIEPNVPFAMLGGGPRHLHRAEVPGPRTAPKETARFHSGARVFASCVIGPDETIYIGSIDGTFNALRLDGRLRWSYICDKPIFSTAAVSQSGMVYVGCDDDTLLAFATNGSLRWTYSMKQDIDSAPVIGRNGVIYVGGDGLHAIKADGGRRFKVWLGGHISASPAVRPDGIIVVGSHDHRVYAVGSNGTVIWSFATKGPIQGPVAALPKNDVVFGSDDSFVYKLTPLGGARWKFKTKGPVRSGVAVSEDLKTLYITSMDGSVYAIDSSTGKERWHVATGGPIRASPMLDSNGMLYVGSRDHHLYAINGLSGDIKWRIDLGAEIDSTAAIAVGRKLLIGADDGAIRVLEEVQ